MQPGRVIHFLGIVGTAVATDSHWGPVKDVDVRDRRVELGERYRFKLADVICPDQRDVQVQVTSQLQVSGEVVFLSDNGGRRDRFAVIEVAGIAAPLIVPVERLCPTREGWSAQPREASPLQRSDGLERTMADPWWEGRADLPTGS